MTTATTPNAAAIWAPGGIKICDDRRPVRKLMLISGKRLLPRLGVSATISPSPNGAGPWVSGGRAKGPGRGQIRSSAPSAAFYASSLGGQPSHCKNLSLIWCAGALPTFDRQVKTKCRGRLALDVPEV